MDDKQWQWGVFMIRKNVEIALFLGRKNLPYFTKVSILYFILRESSEKCKSNLSILDVMTGGQEQPAAKQLAANGKLLLHLNPWRKGYGKVVDEIIPICGHFYSVWWSFFQALICSRRVLNRPSSPSPVGR